MTPVQLLVRLYDGREPIDTIDLRVGPADVAEERVGAQRADGTGAGLASARGARFGAEATWRVVPAQPGCTEVELRIEAMPGEPPPEAGIEVALRLPRAGDPDWLIPGAFYGANRPLESRGRYPRFAEGDALDRHGDPFVAAGWSFRADRAATPLVIATAEGVTAGLAVDPVGQLGLAGLGFGVSPDGAWVELRASAPYREAPVVYDGSEGPLDADLPRHRWVAGQAVTFALRVHLLPSEGDVGGRAAAERRILRDGATRLAAGSGTSGPGIDAAATATVAADGLLAWHLRQDEAALYETIAFERPAEPGAAAPGDRAAMHVAWLSGVPAATALLVHGLRTGRQDATDAGALVLDAIAGNLAPCGTFWGQWTADAGWGKGWTPGEDAVHARTLAEAALFLARAVVAADDPRAPDPPGPRTEGVPGALRGRAARWLAAVESNVDYVVEHQRADGAIPAAWNARTGDPQGWAGTAGLAWVPALVEAAARLGRPDLLAAARRAGAWFAPLIRDGRLGGAPEDVDLGPTSEDGYVAVMAAVALAEAAADDDERAQWLGLARRAADWMLSFRYTWDVPFDAASPLGRMGFRTRGLDQASPANQHVHSYGLVCLPEMARLADLVADPWYLDWTRENLAACGRLIARSDGEFGARRGMMAERFLQTRYGGPRGSLGPLSHAWCLGLLLWGCEAAALLPQLTDGVATAGASGG